MPEPVFLDSEDAHAWLGQHRPERHDPDPWRTPVSIAPTPISPGAGASAAAATYRYRREARAVAITLIGTGLDLIPAEWTTAPARGPAREASTR